MWVYANYFEYKFEAIGRAVLKMLPLEVNCVWRHKLAVHPYQGIKGEIRPLQRRKRFMTSQTIKIIKCNLKQGLSNRSQSFTVSLYAACISHYIKGFFY